MKHAYRDARRYAALRGLVLRGTTKIWDSSLAGIGMLWAKAQGAERLRAYTRAVYERFWKRELDIEDVAVIEAVLREVGAQSDGFRAHATGPGRAAHESMQRAIFDAGVFGVPSYVVEGEVYFGREHLPRVRWILGGRRGPAPDVAYESGATTRALAEPEALRGDRLREPSRVARAGADLRAGRLARNRDRLAAVPGRSREAAATRVGR